MKYNSGKWTEARFHSFIKSALRKASQRWPPKFEALKAAYDSTKKNNKTGRLAKHYLCAECNNVFPAKDVQVDHIHPVVNPEKGFESWGEVIKRMFCEADGFQVLCKGCHLAKTKVERLIAKDRKNARTKK